ncbi:CD81 antigen-like [Acanthaster planci]|uniref:Tetraspanin n=1 Tax=Acanthaster planci TaxID=133434 RepID=A0A8B7XUP0_ACAPL|nr:CD81 antigen-like [Acanthaster planci]
MGGKEGCVMCLRCLMVFFNTLLWLAGVAMLGFGLWLRYGQQFFPNLSPSGDEDAVSAVSAYNIGTYALMAAGAVIMAIGILGCCGAVKESFCLLGLYFVILFLLFGLEVGASAWIYINRAELGNKVGNYFEWLVTEKYDEDKATQVAVDYTQSSLECCGANGHQDWLESGQTIPVSCGVVNCTSDCPEDETLFDEGCKAKVSSIIQGNIFTLVGVCISVAVAQILVMILAVCLCRAIRQADLEYDKCGTV